MKLARSIPSKPRPSCRMREDIHTSASFPICDVTEGSLISPPGSLRLVWALGWAAGQCAGVQGAAAELPRSRWRRWRSSWGRVGGLASYDPSDSPWTWPRSEPQREGIQVCLWRTRPLFLLKCSSWMMVRDKQVFPVHRRGLLCFSFLSVSC